MNNQEIVISGIHMELTDALKEIVREKMQKLIDHEERIIGIKVELIYSHAKTHQAEFTAKGHIEIRGPSIVVSASDDSLYKAIDDLTQKLDRQLRKRSRLNRVKRKTTHAVEIPANLPKSA
tara:strand:- start:64158 stop:64520 length:363 start_codon:yes stop_codon:yes gene_type:complete